MKITTQPVQSKVIHSAGYDPATGTLALAFHGKAEKEPTVFHFAKVPPKTWQAFNESESKGKYFGSTIRNNFKATKQTP